MPNITDMDLIISKALYSDFEAIKDLCIKVSESCVIPSLYLASREAMRRARNRDLRKTYFLENFEVLKAEYGGELVAYLAFREGGYISQLYVKRKYQKQGIGSEILNRYVEGQNIPEIKLVASPNSAEYYLKKGFSKDFSRKINPNPMRLVPLRFNTKLTRGNDHE